MIVDRNSFRSLINLIRDGEIPHYKFYNSSLTNTAQALFEIRKICKDANHKQLASRTFFDIEVFTNNAGEFPDADKARYPINSVSLYNDKYNICYCFLLTDKLENKNQDHYRKYLINRYNSICIERPEYKINDINIIVNTFETEEELITTMFKVIHKLNQFLLVSFNGELFDLPYIVNRSKFLFGSDYENILSEYGECHTIGGFENIKYKIAGLSHVDMLLMYKPVDDGGMGFGKKLPSYSLNSISENILKVNKIDYDGNLDDLYLKNPEEFLFYNMIDSLLLHLLDLKLGFIDNLHESMKLNNVIYSDMFMRSATYGNRNSNIHMNNGELLRHFIHTHESVFNIL